MTKKIKAALIITKKLWNLKVNIHFIDIGSVNEVLENKTRWSWIRNARLKQLRKNLLGPL